jgi:hypothetical protein
MHGPMNVKIKKLRVAFPNFAKAPKIERITYSAERAVSANTFV